MLFAQLIDALSSDNDREIALVCERIAAVIDRALADDQASALLRTLVMTMARHHPAARAVTTAALARLATIADLIESRALRPPFSFRLAESLETGRPRRRDPARPSNVRFPLAKEG